jgi:hypothetical protein
VLVLVGIWAVVVGTTAVFFNHRLLPGAGDWSHPVAHLAVFALLATAARLLWPQLPAPVVALVLVGAGVLLELAQAVAGSDAELRDVLVDGAGIAAGLALVAVGRRLRVPRRLATGGLVVAMAASIVALPLLPIDEDHQLEFDCATEHGRPERAVGLLADVRAADRSMVPAGTVADLVNRVGATNEVTVATWFRAARLDQHGPARIVTISEGPDYHEVDIHLGVEERALTVRIRNECHLFLQMRTGDVLTDTSLHHAAVTYVPGRLDVFLDGRRVADVGVPAGGLGNWDDGFPITVGDEATGDRPFDGDVPEVALYDRALSEAEIGELAAARP